jgi:HAD superfamily hydrolase (TIGR01490 family)
MEAAFFDLDKTVIAKASMVAFGKSLYREGLISRWLLLRALYGQLVYMYLGADEERLARMKDAVLALTKGWEQSRVRAIVSEALTDVVEPIVYDEALQLIREHQEAGRLVYIVSASPVEIVEPLAGYLGVDGFLGTRSEIDAEGRYSGRMEFYCFGPAKRVAMEAMAAERGIDLARSYAYSDSATDIPMLECVGHPVAVNPDRELARVAKEHEWEVRTFSNAVPLRERVPLPPPGPTAAVGGGVFAAAAAGAGVWWYLRKKEQADAARRYAATPKGRLEAARELVLEGGRERARHMGALAEVFGRRATARPSKGSRRPGPSWQQLRRGHRG